MARLESLASPAGDFRFITMMDFSIQQPIAVHWFRRDLRLEDNAALSHALRSGHPVLPLFIFDTDILDELDDKADARLSFIHASLSQLNESLRKLGSGLLVLHGKPLEVWKDLLEKAPIQAVYTNHDYEPYARKRDATVADMLKGHQIPFHTYKDQVIFETDEVVKDNGEFYTVFTPYSKKWLSKLDSGAFIPFDSVRNQDAFLKWEVPVLPTLKDIGFRPSGIAVPSPVLDDTLITQYAQTRNFPSQAGTSRLGVHLRFGTVSIRQLAEKAYQLSDAFLNELIWREYYIMLLWHRPEIVHQEAKPAYRHIPWRYDENDFQRWCDGQTGFPLVDAGMRELNATGFMHNRVRMLVVSFLCKDLLIDWRWGEAYFAQKLLDYEMASNVGNWQWAAGTGFDAAPYFRIFNPDEQARKFDPKGEYIRKWIPEYGTPAYPKPMVNHREARDRAIATYKAALKGE